MKVFKRFLVVSLLAVSLLIQQEYYGSDGLLYVDYILDGDAYTGVYYEDMYDAVNSAIQADFGA